MAGFREMPILLQIVLAVVIGAIVGAGLWYVWVNPVNQDNDQKQIVLDQKKADNDTLRRYERDLPGLEREIASLQQQLEIQRTIVPDEKEAPAFMHLMQDTAASAGIEIRRYTSKPVASREFYTEVPYEMDIDGSYYSVVNFFERVAKLQRIINIGSLQMAIPKRSGDAKVKSTYTYAPNESVVASVVATTFFNHDSNQTAPSTAPARTATPAPAAAR
ncbi:MAG TPA: type 4a pilus biogenesis protein PilO [Terriglobales bacterium]|jgi:type IV pilus assembly protein PilO|nr:type 4a pilus biogenesis protein PilO [Terriglobales bacterium]